MIRALAQWHEDERLVAFAAAGWGRLLVWVVAAALVYAQAAWGAQLLGPLLVLVPWVMACVTLWPGRRREILTAASAVAVAVWAAERGVPGDERWLRCAVLVAGVLLGLWLVVVIVRRSAVWPAQVRRIPVLTLHAGALSVAALIPVAPLLGVMAELLPLVLWRLSYLVQYAVRNPQARVRMRDHGFYLWPLVGVARSVPVGKGFEYLERTEARDPARLAGSQLAGIKLLALALAWTLAGWWMDSAVFGDLESPARAWLGGWSLGMTRLPDLLVSGRTEAGAAVAAIYLQLVRDTLALAATGHVLVGCWRLFGFRIHREVYRPLLAESVLEFWNRRSWYLKELLAEFFFYPTFVRCAWAPMRLRLFLAAFAAAGVGNLYCHALQRIRMEPGDGPALASHAVYGALLAVGIWISMLRERSRRHHVPPVVRLRWQRLRACAGVWTFYAVVHLWSINLGTLGPLERLRWLVAVITP